MEDYQGSAIRHLRDAKNLKANGSLDNAGHLVGFAAECAIKYKIGIVCGCNDNPKLHLPQLIEAAKKRLNSRSGASMFQILSGSLLQGWDINRRYFNTGDTTTTELDAWMNDAVRLIGASGIREKK